MEEIAPMTQSPNCLITVDSHQHYWQLHRFSYGWIEPDNAVLYKDRMPADLQPQMDEAGIQRSVFVHATSTPDEIPWMLQMSDKHPYIAGVVGWLDLTAPDAGERVAEFAGDHRFKGVRLNVPYAEAKRSALDGGLSALGRYGLSCDLLLGSAGLSGALPLIASHPDVIFVLDHFAGTPIVPGGEAEFVSSVTPIAAYPNVAMKLSGYRTASAGVPTEDVPRILAPYINMALRLFGPGRLMFGSDWPVCTMGGNYATAVGILRTLTEALSPDQQVAIWGGTATRVYRLM
jgi:L-fuconolactonase